MTIYITIYTLYNTHATIYKTFGIEKHPSPYKESLHCDVDIYVPILLLLATMSLTSSDLMFPTSYPYFIIVGLSLNCVHF